MIGPDLRRALLHRIGDADHRGKKGKKKGGNQQGPKDGPGRRGKKGK